MIKQMRRPDVRILERMRRGNIDQGFKRDRVGRIFFLFTHGHADCSCPVLEDGSIYLHGAFDFPDEDVDLVHPADLGTSEFRFAH